MCASVETKKVILFLRMCVLLGLVQRLTCSVCDVDAMEEYLALVYAGLTGSVTMITCTVLALTRLVFEYKGRPHCVLQPGLIV